MNREVSQLIRKLGLNKHPEGGYFKQTYVSDAVVNVSNLRGPRNIATAIYYLLFEDEFSAFHRLKSDEIWHYYAGEQVLLYTIGSKGKLHKTRIGKYSVFQVVVKSGVWFAAGLVKKKSYCLLGCTMSPGFDVRDWELGKREDLIKMYPLQKKIIERYTK